MHVKTQLHIRTYDSIPTDLAGEMRDWREFVRGEAYDVHLRDDEAGEEVTILMRDTPDDFPTVIVEGRSRSVLFDRAAGRVIQALGEHSDSLMIDDVTSAEQGDGPNEDSAIASSS